MGRSGIWLVALRPGETAEEAVARTTAGWIEPDDDDVALVGNEEHQPTELGEATDQWIERIVGLLRGENPTFEISEEHLNDAGYREWVVLEDPAGPVAVTIYGDQVQLLPRSTYEDPDG